MNNITYFYYTGVVACACVGGGTAPANAARAASNCGDSSETCNSNSCSFTCGNRINKATSEMNKTRTKHKSPIGKFQLMYNPNISYFLPKEAYP